MRLDSWDCYRGVRYLIEGEEWGYVYLQVEKWITARRGAPGAD
jgi:hypothetical protein